MTISLFARAFAVVTCLAALVAQPLTPSVAASPDPQGAAKAQGRQRISVAPVYVFGGADVVQGAGSQLTRTEDGVFMTLHASGLEPGTVATAWWVFFNDPKRCADGNCTPADLSNPDAQPSLLIAAGRVVGPDGTADFGAYRAVGDTTGAVLGPGLLSPFRAEIHLVVRTHGPARLDDPAVLQEQLTAFNGGCPTNTCSNLLASVHQP
jgi:hypothetical protein